jgi:hypothetical protein
MSRRLSFALSTALLSTLVVTAPANAETTIVKLEGLAPATSVNVMSINDSGVAVGSSTARNLTRAVKFEGDRTIPFSGPADASINLLAVNNHGAAAGRLSYPGSTDTNPIRFNPDGTYAVLSIPFGYTHATAVGINDNGITYGIAWGDDDQTIPVSWRPNGVLTAMKLPVGTTEGRVVSASPNGYAAGYVFGPGRDWVPVRWNPGNTVTVLPTPADGIMSRASAVNRNGDVVGVVETATGGRYGLRWNADGSMDRYGPQDEPTGINDHGTVVGYGRVDNQLCPFRWTREGEKLDLGLLEPANSIDMMAINNDGVIVGTVWGKAYKWIVS